MKTRQVKALIEKLRKTNTEAHFAISWEYDAYASGTERPRWVLYRSDNPFGHRTKEFRAFTALQRYVASL